ncbi:MAG: ABC transporter substrate-binding protein [Acidimicrobiales bacterium]
MRRRARWLVPAVAVVAASCGGGGAGGAAVNFLVFGEPEELRAFRSVVAAFERGQDAVEVKLVEASGRTDLLTRLSTSLAAGSPPDLVLLNYRFYGQFAAKGALEPVERRLGRSSAFSPEDFYAEALEAFRWEGAQTCLPQNVSSLATFYNKDLFGDAGLAEPGDDWTWDDMTRAAAALTVDEDRDGTVERYGLGVEPGLIRLAPLVWSSGGEVVDDQESPTGFALDTAPALNAVQDLIDLRSKLLAIPTDEEMESEDLESRFLHGRLGMLLSSRRVVPTLRSVRDFEWDVAPLPARATRVNVLHSDAYCITRASSRKEAAWRFVEFALGAEGQRIAAATGRTVPSLKEVAGSEAFLDPEQPPSRAQVFLDAIPGIRRLPSISTWPEIEDLADALLEEAVFEPGGGEAVEVVQSLKAETAPLFERAE